MVTDCHQFDDIWAIPLPTRCEEINKPATCAGILEDEIIPEHTEAENCEFCEFACYDPIPLNANVPTLLGCTFEEVGEAHSGCPVY